MNNNEAYNSEQDSVSKKYEEELVGYIGENDYTSEETMKAYLEMLGVGDEEESTDRIKALAQKIREITDAGFPLNRVVGVIKSRKEFESIPETCTEYIKGLNISDKEKNMLVSIYEKDREGELSVVVRGHTIAVKKIPVLEDKVAKAYFISSLLKQLEKIIPAGVDYQFIFSE